MATIALVLFPELGHVHGALGLATRLRDAGHRVVAVGAPDAEVRATVEHAGLAYREATSETTGRALAELAPELALVDANLPIAPWLHRVRAAFVHTALPNVRVAGRGPITGRVIGGASIAAHAASALAWRLGAARRLAPAERLTPPRPSLVVAPRELDPAADTLPPQFAWLGACIDPARREVATPPPLADLLARSGPLAYCAFGSQGERMRGRERLIRSVLGAAARLPAWRFAIASGGHVERARLGRVPPNACVVDRCPQLAVLAHAQVMITHAGLNSVKECIAAAVPMLAIPLDHDQPGNAARIARLGLRIAPERATAGAIAAALVELLYEPAHAARVVAFRTRTDHYQRAAAEAVDRLLHEP